MLIIILVIVILLCSSISGGVGYWKREDLFGTGEDDDGGGSDTGGGGGGSDTGGGGGGSDTGGGGGGSAALAALGESCSVNTCESPLVCNEYSMKCANAPVTPPFGDSSVNYTSLSQANRDSIGSGWKQIKYIPGTSATWFPGNDQLKGYGGTEFLFTTGDFSRWLICDQSVVNGRNYFNEDRTIKKSSISAVPYTAKWYYRHWDPIDPWVSLEDHEVSVVSNTLMYGENNTTGHSASIHSTGMYVFVR
jgi:hypothetical protein